MRRFGLYSSASALAMAAFLASGGGAHAALTLTGNYLDVGTSDYGTLGSDGSTEPGLIYDPKGVGNFFPGGISNDFLTPGSPHEGFTFTSNEIGDGPSGFLSQDNNAGGGSFTTLSGPVAASVPGYSLTSTWTGSYTSSTGAVLTVTNTEYFNPNSQQINIKTLLTSSINLTGAAFGRSLDPDPDVNLYGSYATLNSVGNSSYGADANSAACGTGASTNQTVCLVTSNTQGTITHVADINGPCCSNTDPFTFIGEGSGLFGGATADADNSINLTWDIGNITAGTPVELDYAYVLGATLTTVVAPPTSTTPTPTPPPTPAPEPASLALLGSGLVGLAVMRRRRRHG